MNIKGPTTCQNTVQEPVTSINSKTTEISHSFFHWYKFPNHEKVKLLVLSTSKELFRYAHTIILNENESCQLKLTNLVN